MPRVKEIGKKTVSGKRIDNILSHFDFSMIDDKRGNAYIAIPLPKGTYKKADALNYLTACDMDWIRTIEGGRSL